MKHFRNLLDRLNASGDLLIVNRPVNASYELAALLKQAESRRKAIRFNSVGGTKIPVIGGLLTTAQRMAQGLDIEGADTFTRHAHATLIREAIRNPLAAVEIKKASCQDVVIRGDEVDCAELPVPTFFADDSGPFLTAAVGVSRNPDNGILNVGMYRVLMLGADKVAVSASPSSDLFRFLKAAASHGEQTPVALVVGPDPAVLMAAAAKVPANISELDVAGALNGESLELISAVSSDLLVPAHSEIIIEVMVGSDEQITNTMGEFGDFYGEQSAPLATVTAITRREDAVFHTVMAGAGREHNSIGFIILYEIEPELKKLLSRDYSGIVDLRVYFEPPRMGVLGDVYVALAENAGIDVHRLIREIFEMRCNELDLARVVRRVVIVDDDINLQNRQEIDWAISTRANTADQIELFSDLPASGGKVRIGIDARANPDERVKLRRLAIPGSEKLNLDDYLG